MRPIRLLPAAMLVAMQAAHPSMAGMTWTSVTRSAITFVGPEWASNSAFSSQLLGNWSESASCVGPSYPDPLIQPASAQADHVSSVSGGSIAWASLSGWVHATHATFPAPELATATIQLEAAFTLTESSAYELRNLVASNFAPDATIHMRLKRGETTIFDRLGPVVFILRGSLSAGDYSLLLEATSSNADPGRGGCACDMRFAIPAPGAALALLLGGLHPRRRR